MNDAVVSTVIGSRIAGPHHQSSARWNVVEDWHRWIRSVHLLVRARHPVPAPNLLFSRRANGDVRLDGSVVGSRVTCELKARDEREVVLARARGHLHPRVVLDAGRTGRERGAVGHRAHSVRRDLLADAEGRVAVAPVEPDGDVDRSGDPVACALRRNPRAGRDVERKHPRLAGAAVAGRRAAVAHQQVGDDDALGRRAHEQVEAALTRGGCLAVPARVDDDPVRVERRRCDQLSGRSLCRGRAAGGDRRAYSS